MSTAESLSPTTGKAPAHPTDHAQTHTSRLVNVQAACLADLQPRYAQSLEHDEENPEAHGWYAGLSTFDGLGQNNE